MSSTNVEIPRFLDLHISISLDFWTSKSPYPQISRSPNLHISKYLWIRIECSKSPYLQISLGIGSPDLHIFRLRYTKLPTPPDLKMLSFQVAKILRSQTPNSSSLPDSETRSSEAVKTPKGIIHTRIPPLSRSRLPIGARLSHGSRNVREELDGALPAPCQKIYRRSSAGVS